MLSVWTSASEVRAALGVESDELTDETLALPIYEQALLAELEDVHDDIPEDFETLRATTVLTSAQQRFVSAVHVFATYSVASHLTVSLPLFAPRSVEDGKSRIERFTDPYRKTIEGVSAQRERWRDRLRAAHESLTQSAAETTARTLFSAAAAATDPITGS